MVDAKITKSTGVISLACSILGCLGTVALPAIYSHSLHQETTGVTAGLAVLGYGFLSGTFCLFGVIFAIVTLRRIRRGKGSGQIIAWTGIVLGCLPFIVLVAYMLPGLWRDLWDWIGSAGSGGARRVHALNVEAAYHGKGIIEYGIGEIGEVADEWSLKGSGNGSPLGNAHPT